MKNSFYCREISLLLSIIDRDGVVAVIHAIAVKRFAGISLIHLTNIVQVVGAPATGAVGIAALLQGEPWGGVALFVAVAASKVEACDHWVVCTQLGGVGQSHDKSAQPKVHPMVHYICRNVYDARGACGLGNEHLVVLGFNGAPLPH